MKRTVESKKGRILIPCQCGVVLTANNIGSAYTTKCPFCDKFYRVEPIQGKEHEFLVSNDPVTEPLITDEDVSLAEIFKSYKVTINKQSKNSIVLFILGVLFYTMALLGSIILWSIIKLLSLFDRGDKDDG